VVYFGEVDTVWGEESKGNIGDGGQVTERTTGADGVNVETKNVFLDLKFGDTAATLGIKTTVDAFDGIVFMEDMPGVDVTHKIGGTTLRALYSKWDEDYATTTSANTTTGAVSTTAKADSRGDWDDLDFYGLEVKQKFGDNFSAGIAAYFKDDNRDNAANVTVGDKEIYFYGVNADAKFGNFGLNGFFMMQDGEYQAEGAETATNYDYDIEGMAATVKGTMKLASGDLGLRVIYFSEDDDDQDNGRWQGFQGEYFFVNDNQMQFLVDKYVANDGKEMYAIKDSVDQGYGLLAFVASGNHKLPSDMYLNWGAGYYMAMDEERDDAGVDSREGDQLGYEVCARFGKKFLEKVDISLNASYAGYGDFYDNTVDTNGSAAGGLDEDPDDTYKAYLMVSVPW